MRNVRLDGRAEPVDITFDADVIARIEVSSGRGGFEGRYAFPGYVDCHVHLDKAHILDRTLVPGASLADAISRVRAAKRGFTVDDVTERAERVLRSAVSHGTTLLRSSVEVDPDAGLRSFEALSALRERYAEHVDLRLSAFAQDGTSQSPETLDLLEQAVALGADEVGGCTYTDPDPRAHVRAILAIAEDHGIRADFHIDFDLDPADEHLSLLLDEVERRGMHGRVSIGHATKLAVLSPGRRDELARRLRDLGVPLVALPATDLFLVGAIAPPDLVVAVATNNVCNPFTPFGDADLLRMANLFALTARWSADTDMRRAWDAVTAGAASVLGEERVIEVGAPATIVIVDAADPVVAVRELRRPLARWYRGRADLPDLAPHERE